MKKTLLFAAAAAIALCASGQVLPNGKPDPNFRFQQQGAEAIEATLDEQAQPQQRPNFRPAANSGVLITRSSDEGYCNYEIHDANGNLTFGAYYTKNVFTGDDWYCSTKYEYGYDSQGRIMSYLYAEGPKFSTGSKSTYTYSDNGYEIFTEGFGYQNNKMSKQIVEYNAAGDISTSRSYESIDGIEWKLFREEIYTYTYDENGLCTEAVYHSYYNGELFFATKTNFVYNELGQKSQISYYNLLTEQPEESWWLRQVCDYSYDANGNMTFSKDVSYNKEGVIYTTSLSEISYTDDNQVAESIYTWIDDWGESKQKTVNEYDSDGVILHIYDYNWQNDDWYLRSATDYAWGAPEPETCLVEHIYLVGSPNGWPEPSANNADVLEPWKLLLVKGRYAFYGEFEIPEGEAMFRFYSALNGWEQDSWGCHVDDYPSEYEIENYFGYGMVAGKGSFYFPNWPGGKMYILVEPSYDYCWLTIQTEPMDVEVDGIANVSVAPAAGPAEYYNLQGVKIENPQRGQFYICRQGSKVTKIIY